MTLASDQKASPSNPSEITRKMLELREVVLAEWEKRVRSSLEEARSLAHPILINTVPAFYTNIAEALTPDYPRTSAAVATPSVATEHGGERARLTSYEAHTVISEYQIFRSTIIDVLSQNNVQINDQAMRIISSSIDAAIRDAVTAFTLVQSAFRERYVAALAHDLRNPLAVATSAALLIPRITNLQTIHAYAEKITENLSRIDHMIQEMLDTVVFQHGERLPVRPSHFDIAEVVREICHEFSAVHGPRFEIDGTSVSGWWGRDEIKRGLENLINNAVKYGTPGTPIRIAFEETHGRLILSVHNDGAPIPPDQVEAVFQAFRRAKAAKEGDKRGWGIGLPFARSVAESHGGSLDVDSAEERGTTFTIDIPIDSRPFQHAPTL